MHTDVPAYLEAPDNEDSSLICECGEPVYEDGPYDWLCLEHTYEAEQDAYWDRLADEQADRDMFPEDYERYDD